MWLSGQRSSSGASLNTSVSVSDSAVESTTSIESNHARFAGSGILRKNAALDASFPRVHSTGRGGDGFPTKGLQPDLIYHHPEIHRKLHSFDASSALRNSTEIPPSITQNENVAIDSSVYRRYSDTTTKLNIPGNSVIVSESNPLRTIELMPVPLVTADKLTPYPPGLITVVKEGPPHESPSALLATIEKELEDLKYSELGGKSISMDPDDENYSNGNEVQENGFETTGCHCRLALEERLHATVKGCLQLQHEVELVHSKCVRWEKEAGDAAENVSMLRNKVSELEIELAARNASLHGLKSKVAQQFMENDDINERRRQFERDCKAQLTQLDSLKKSEQWYREQLHLTQVERSDLQKELMAFQEKNVRQVHDLERLKSDLQRVKDQLLEAEEKSIKDKQKFTLQLEKALSSTTCFSTVEETSNSKELVDDHVALELKQRIADLELSSVASYKNLDRSREEIDRLLSRSLQLQRELSETKIKLQEEQERCMSASKDREKAEAELKERERVLSTLSREHAELAVKLECQARERAEQDEALQTLTRNFTNVSARFNAMRAETQEQRSAAEALRAEVRVLQGERDALQTRLQEGARRDQANAVQARLEASDREAARSAREAQLEHDVLGLREALECARGAQQRADELQAERDRLHALNEQLQAQVDRLSQLLQQNTGSKVRELDDGAQLAKAEEMFAENGQLRAVVKSNDAQIEQLRSHLKSSAAQVEQLQSDNGQLQGQVQRSTARLAELTRTIEELEAAMAELRRQEDSQPHGDLVQLRAENAQLQRAKHDLTTRVAELTQWLDTVTQGLHLGAQSLVGEKLARLSASPVHVEGVGGGAVDGGDEQLRVLRDANDELALYAAALQRRLDNVENGQVEGVPDLVSSSGEAATMAQVGEARGLLALLQVCLYRVREAHAADGLGVGVDGDEVRRLTASIGKLSGATEVAEDDGEVLQTRLQEEHRDLREREGRRDDLVRELLGRLKEQILARKAAEQKLTHLGLLGLPAEHTCHTCTPAAGDSLVERLSVDPERGRLEQELAQANASIAELHKQLFGERRDSSQLRKEVSSLRLGLDTANDMLDSNKVALGRSEAYGQVLKVSKDQLQARFEQEQRDHEDCRLRLERLQEQLQEARAKDPLVEAQIKTLGCHLHQRSSEVRALQDKLSVRDHECDGLRAQLDRQKAAAHREYDALLQELQQAQREFADALRNMSSNVPDPAPCDEEALSALIQESNRLSPTVLGDLKALLHNLKAELRSVERGVGIPYERVAAPVLHV
ncbi:rootletin isoform X3 [Frankliniella occidentalis]|nr:rootletin isoform X3 [Frankliniella occidentalis]